MAKRMKISSSGFGEQTIYDGYSTAENVDKVIAYIKSKYKESRGYKHVALCRDNQLLKSLTKDLKPESCDVKRIDYGEAAIKIVPATFCYVNKVKEYCVATYSFYDASNLIVLPVVFYNDEKKLLSCFSFENFVKLDAGVYEILEGAGGPSINKVLLTECTKPLLNDDYQDALIKDITKFFGNEQFYKDNGFTYKRGLLLYGPGGTGKSSLIKYIGTQVDVPTLIINGKVDMDSQLKELIDMSCPNGCIVAIEDIDGIEAYKRSELLNFLDGMSSPKRCYFIATTNHLERVGYALANRPSRFDMVVEVPEPKEDTREKLIKHYFGKDAASFDMPKLLSETKGFTGAFIKELFILYKLNDVSIIDAVKKLKKHMNIAKSVKDEDNYID